MLKNEQQPLWTRFKYKKRDLHERWRRLKKLFLIPLIKPLKEGLTKRHPRYIISLTSYGKRIANTAPYAIITLLYQSVQPDKIILWLGHNDKENIPKILKTLTKKGLEIRFCEDIKSYTKLIYALNEFPSDNIIIADDDIFYPKHWLEQMTTLHEKYPQKIICHRAHGIKTDGRGKPLAYNEWDKCIKPSLYFHNKSHKPECVFPTGVGGILYPTRACLHKDAANKELFLKIAPYADDVWFWAMAVINTDYFGGESPYIVLENGHSRKLHEIDWQQHMYNSLQSSNVTENRNDSQLSAVIEHYPQITHLFKKI